MALHWNIGKIIDCDTVCYIGEGSERRLNPTTETLIFATMIVGLTDITEKNCAEFAFRVAFFERLNGGLRVKWQGDEPQSVCFTVDEIKAHIGLHTNAGNATRAAWVKRVLLNFERDYKWAQQQREKDASLPACDGCGKRSLTVEDAGGRVEDGADGLAFCDACRK